MTWGVSKSSILAATVLAAVVVAWAGVTSAQIGRLPIEPNRASYEVRLVNEMGYPIRVKMVRYGTGQYLEADLKTNGSITRQVYAGDRVLCVWNRNELLTLAVQVNVDSSGTLRLRPLSQPYAAQPAPLGGPRRGTAESPAEPLPRLSIER